MTDRDRLAGGLQALGVSLNDAQQQALLDYRDLLVKWNRAYNLTAVRDPGEMIQRHLLDSLSVLAHLDDRDTLDVGTGAGLPGIPLAIVCPGLRVGLVETTGKKATFLEETVGVLGLENVTVFNDRAERLAAHGEPQREAWDIVTARAVGRLPVLLELTVPFARVDGHVLAIKGGQADEEIEEARAALHRLHVSVVETVRTTTGTIVVIEKPRPTPKCYPRGAGEPKRSPLRG